MDYLERAVIYAILATIIIWLVIDSVVIAQQGNIIQQLKDSQTIYISDDKTLSVVGQQIESDSDLHDAEYQMLGKINKTLETLTANCKPKG